MPCVLIVGWGAFEIADPILFSRKTIKICFNFHLLCHSWPVPVSVCRIRDDKVRTSHRIRRWEGKPAEHRMLFVTREPITQQPKGSWIRFPAVYEAFYVAPPGDVLFRFDCVAS